MDNVVSFPRDRKEYEAAAAWLARLDRGLDDGERAALASWLAESGANADALIELAVLWDDLERLSELSALLPLERPAAPRRAPRRALAALAAAVVVLAAGLGFRVWLAPPQEPPAAAAAAAYEKTIATVVGERAAEVLPDGSQITLNTYTEIAIRYSSQRRVVDMRRGEAHFSIARNARRPFAVLAAGRVVEAVGTAFNVRLDPERGGVEVIVTEGEVHVFDGADPSSAGGTAHLPSSARDAAQATALAQGQGLRLERGAPDDTPVVRELEPVDLDIKLAWQRGMVIFRGEPLEAVLAEFGRYTTTQLILGDETLADVRVGGYFRAGDIEGLLAALRENFRIEAERAGGDRIVLRAQNDR